MKQVLFVDDEPMVLQGLKRLLRPVRDRWEMHFESDSGTALERLEQQHFDVVVSDMRMPSYTGVDVLRHAKRHCPDAVRIGLSGYADSQLVLEAAQVTHQFLAKPCDSEKLVSAVDRVVRLQERLNSDDLRRNIGALSTLPSLPALYLRVTQEAAAPNGTLESVGEIIGQDLAMTAKILQLVNSAYFGLRTQVASARQAATILGLEAIRAMVLTVELFSSFDENDDEVEVADVERLWAHSIATGGLAKQIAVLLKLEGRGADQALLAGMLHDVGKLIEISRIQRAYRLVKGLVEKGGFSDIEAEEQLLGCNHADIGAYLLTLWGFPSPVVEAVAYHHDPSSCITTAAAPLTAVHLANAVAAGGGDQSAVQTQLDGAYLARLGLPSDAAYWLSALHTDGPTERTFTHHG